MEKQVKFNSKIENAGIRTIVDLSSKLNQVLRTLDGIYGEKLPECDNMTVEAFMLQMGVAREVKVSENGRITKKGITVKSLREGWSKDMMIDGGMGMYQSVYAKYVEGDMVYDVYSQEEANKEVAGEAGSPIRRWTLRPVDFEGSGWSIRKIFRGLKQGRHITRQVNRMDKELKAWQAEKKVYIVKNVEGSLTAVEVDKCKVTF